MKGLILDLRFNPGGILKTAVEVCDMFIDKGVIVSTKGRITPNWEATATKEGTLPYFPMVVLINPFSASASEIVSGCLQDHHRAIIMGERSFGKGSVQNVISLEGEKAALKLTTSKYYMPNGRSIHRDEDMKETDEWGVMPDIVTPMTPEDYIGILRARMEAEVIHKGVNGVKPDAAKSDKPKPETPSKSEKPKADAPKPETPRSEAPATPDPDEAMPPGAAKPDEAAPKIVKPAEDKQLLRALDVIRSIDIIEKYLKKEPVKMIEQPKPAEAKKAA